MASPYSKIQGRDKFRALTSITPQTSQPITYLPYPNAYNRPSSQIHSTFTVPSGRVINRPERNIHNPHTLPIPSSISF